MKKQHQRGLGHETIPETNPEAEALRARLVELGCTMDRQWGGAPVFIVNLPGTPARQRGARYQDHPDRAAARLAGMRNAFQDLEWERVMGRSPRTRAEE